MAKERLDKLLAGQGTISRKEIKALIKKGNVQVNGEVCLLPERKIDPEEDKIEISGALLNFKRHVYIMMHKPPGRFERYKRFTWKNRVGSGAGGAKTQGAFSGRGGLIKTRKACCF